MLRKSAIRHAQAVAQQIERCANDTSALPGLKVPFMPSADVILSADEKRVVLEVCLRDSSNNV
jgi:hypothetical protein